MQEQKIMQEQLQVRLKVLKAELAAGQLKLRELELRQLRLREVLLRLRGAIQVLEELLGQAKPETAAPQQASPSAEHDLNQPVALVQEGRPGTGGGGPP
jgi:predicted nuclease with TOPRIM domain